MHLKAMSETDKYKISEHPGIGGTKTKREMRYSLILSKTC